MIPQINFMQIAFSYYSSFYYVMLLLYVFKFLLLNNRYFWYMYERYDDGHNLLHLHTQRLWLHFIWRAFIATSTSSLSIDQYICSFYQFIDVHFKSYRRKILGLNRYERMTTNVQIDRYKLIAAYFGHRRVNLTVIKLTEQQCFLLRIRVI